MPGTLAISLLGSPRVDVSGQPLAVDTRKAIALLAYLAVTGRPHRRESLATLLWPDYDDASARATLRRTLSALKKGLGGGWIATESDQVALAPGCWLDVAEFRTRLAAAANHGHPAPEPCAGCVAPLQEAVALYGGDFLAGFTLRESPTFDDWQAFEADALRRELAGALRGVVHALASRGAFAEALPFARRWLALDPLHEAAHRQLMLLHAWADERGAALRQYRACVQVLQDELGVAPLDETTQLAEAIKERRSPPPPVAVPHGSFPVADTTGPSQPVPPLHRMERGPGGEVRPVSVRRPTPFVGRDVEWRALLRAYESVNSRDGGRLVVVEGEAGIGKTRLAEELLAHVRSFDATTATARCYEGEASLAYAPVAAALREALAAPDGTARLSRAPFHALAEASRLLPEIAALHPGPTASPADGPGAHARFLDGLARVASALLSPLAELAGEGGAPAAGPGVLVLDDAQWADAATLDFLAYLARRLPEWPLLVLVTWRTEAVPPEHRLRALVDETRRAGRGAALALGRLGLGDVARLLRQTEAAPAAVLDETAAALHRQSEGLPFFLVEYLAARRDGEPASVPGGVRALLRGRLAAADETGRQLLAAAAVIGRSFDLDVLREASGRSEDELIAGLEQLLRLGLLKEPAAAGGAPELDFTHDRLREVVYEDTSLIRRRLLHRRVAEALRSRTRGRPDAGALAGQIARHYQAGGLDAEAAHHFRSAGEHARSVFANAEALVHFGAALALGHPEPAALHEAIGDLQTLAGDYAAAQASYEAAAAGAPAARGAVEHKLGRLYVRRGEWELAEHHFGEAFDAPPDAAGDEAGRARLLATWSYAAHRRGDSERAAGLASRALELAERSAEPAALAEAHNTLGLFARERGAAAQARHHLERSLSLASTSGQPAARVAALNNLALACAADGDLERACSLAEEALALCTAQGDRHREAALHGNLADLLHSAGRADAAIQHVKQAVALLAQIGMSDGQPESIQPEIWKLVEW